MSSQTTVNEIHSNGFPISDDVYWFSAECKYGLLYIGIYRNTIFDGADNFYKFTVLEMVKTLNREEVIIRSIEDWLQVGLNIRPCETHVCYDYKITLYTDEKQTDKNHGKLILAFSEEVLKLLPCPDEICDQNIQLESSVTPVDLILSSTAIHEQYVQSLKPGAILLIPDSFSQKWCIKINDRKGVTSGLYATVDNDIKRLHLENNQQLSSEKLEDNSSLNSDDIHLHIVINNEIHIPFDILHKWKQEGEIVLSKPLINHKIEIHNNNVVVATGHLLSITNGYGVFIDTL